MKSKIHEYQNKYVAMSKISKLIFAIAIGLMITMASCRDTKTTEEHGHEHNADGSHMENKTIEQEEFKVGADAMEVNTEAQDSHGNHLNEDSKTHKHDDGAAQHDH